MKKLLVFISLLFFISGCGKYSEENVVNDLIIEDNTKTNIFQIEFSDQNLTDNIKFRNWKKYYLFVIINQRWINITFIKAKRSL